LDKEYLTPKDLSNLFGIKKPTIYKLTKDIPHYQIGNSIRYKKEDVSKWLAEQKIEPIPELDKKKVS